MYRIFLITIFMFQVCFVSHLKAESYGLHYQCEPEKITSFELHHAIKNPKDWDQSEIDSLNMVFNLVYLGHEMTESVPRFDYKDVFKGALLFYGQYETVLEDKYPIKRNLDSAIVRIVREEEFDEVALRGRGCSSFFCALGIVMDYFPPMMRYALELGSIHYVGGLTGSDEQIDQEVFISKVTKGIVLEDPLMFEKIFNYPTTLYMLEIPAEFAAKTGEPQTFKMRSYFIDELFGIIDSNSQALVRRDIDFVCVRQADLGFDEILEMLTFSSASKYVTPTLKKYIDKPIIVNFENSEDDEVLLDWFNGNLSDAEMKKGIKLASLGAVGLSLWKLKKYLSPPTAFAAGLGIAPVYASDYCGPYLDPDRGLSNFSKLKRNEQIEVLNICPQFRERLLEFFFELGTYE